MGTNFQFLKKVNKNLYEIITEAEKLYRDEYFEQCMTQTRRFGEQICKDMLMQNNKQTGSFDDMLASLKDNMNGHQQEKEFIDDLYFLKKNGNKSVHSGTVKKDALTALECLKRSFEIAINYSVYNQGASSGILKLNYDVELLITNKKSGKSLSEKYCEEKQKQKQKISKPKKENSALDRRKIPEYRKSKPLRIPFFWKIVFAFSVVSVLLILFLVILSVIGK